MDNWDSDKERLAEALNIRNDTAKQQPIVNNALEALKTSPVLNELPEILKQHKPRKRRDYRCGKCGMVKKNHICPKMQNMNASSTQGSCSFSGSILGRSEKRKTYKPLKLVLVENDQPETRQYLMELQQIGVEKIGIQLIVITKKEHNQEDFDIVVQAVYGNRAPTYIGKVSWYYKGIVRSAIEDNSITKVELLKIYEDESLLLTSSSFLDPSRQLTLLSRSTGPSFFSQLPTLSAATTTTTTTTTNYSGQWSGVSGLFTMNLDNTLKCSQSHELSSSLSPNTTSTLECTNISPLLSEDPNLVTTTNALLTTDLTSVPASTSTTTASVFNSLNNTISPPSHFFETSFSMVNSAAPSELVTTSSIQTLASTSTTTAATTLSTSTATAMNLNTSSSLFSPPLFFSSFPSIRPYLLPHRYSSSLLNVSPIPQRKVLTAQLAIYRNQSWHTKRLQEANYSSSHQPQA